MVLGALSYPSAGPQQGYVHKEEYYKNDQYNNGAAAVYKEDYYSKDGYYSNSPSSYTRPNPSIHSPHGHNHHVSGGYGGYTTPGGPYSQGHGGAFPPQGPVSYGYGTPHGSHIPVGPNRIQSTGYEHRHSGSSAPYYGQNQRHSWISKDLDD